MPRKSKPTVESLKPSVTEMINAKLAEIDRDYDDWSTHCRASKHLGELWELLLEAGYSDGSDT